MGWLLGAPQLPTVNVLCQPAAGAKLWYSLSPCLSHSPSPLALASCARSKL